jgi:hypothetical protein
MDDDRDYGPRDPCSVDQFLNRVLAAAERPLMTMLGEEEETIEIAKAIIDDSFDLPG